jgi:hypothetical protein
VRRELLAVLIPLGALAMVAGIGIPIGLLFLEVHDIWSEDVTLVVAVALTAAIMAVAAVLSVTWANKPEAAQPAARQTTPTPTADSGARRPRTERPARGGRSRSSGRRRSG